jgi:hypothetical protein
MGFFVEQADRSYQSRIAAEDIHVGTLVAEGGNDTVVNVDDTDTELDGLAGAPRSGDYVAKELHSIGDTGSASTSFVYQSAEDDRVPFLPVANSDLVKVYTITDNSTDPEPSISDGDVVGVAQKNDDAFRGRLVEEGYTDNGATTYNRSSDNFTAVGKAYKDESATYDETVRVSVRLDI